MANKRNLKLNEYGISQNRYRELKYFCLQYKEMKSKLLSLCVMSAITYNGMPTTSSIGKPTEKIAEIRIKLKNDLELIEQTAIETDEEIYQYILDNVTTERPYEHLNIPCGKRKFYATRRKFFYLLSVKKGN